MQRTIIATCFIAVIALAGCATRIAQIESSEPSYRGPVVRLRYAPGPSNIIQIGKPTALDYVNARREEAGLPLIAVDDKLAEAAALNEYGYGVVPTTSFHGGTLIF